MTGNRTKVEQQDDSKHTLTAIQPDTLPSHSAKKRWRGRDSSSSRTSTADSQPQSRKANTSDLVARCVQLTNTRVRRRGRSYRMGEGNINGERQQMRSQLLRSHTSYATSRQLPHLSAERPSTATGYTQLPTQTLLLTRQPTEHHRPTSHTAREKWNNSTRVEKPTSALSMVTTGGFTRPSTNKTFRTFSSVAAEILSVKKLNMARDDDITEVKVSQNKAVETAFERAISHRTVNSERVRVGLITNDITPRVYLQESKGSRQFKKMNMKLREQLTDVYNYRCLQTSLPSSPHSDNDSNDGQSSDNPT